VEKELEKVKGALEDFGKKVVDAVKKGKGEADKVAKSAQVKIEIGSLQRQQKELYQELGELFYKNYRKPAKKAEAAMTESVTHIDAVEKQVASLKRSLKAIKEDRQPKRRGRPPKAETKKAAPKRRGRPPKAASSGQEKPKRRGRPPKAK